MWLKIRQNKKYQFRTERSRLEAQKLVYSFSFSYTGRPPNGLSSTSPNQPIGSWLIRSSSRWNYIEHEGGVWIEGDFIDLPLLTWRVFESTCWSYQKRIVWIKTSLTILLSLPIFLLVSIELLEMRNQLGYNHNDTIGWFSTLNFASTILDL